MRKHARLAQRADHIRGHVARRGGRPGGDDDRVTFGQRLARHRLQRRKIIFDNSIADRFPARARHQRRQRVRVNVTHLAGTCQLVRLDNFVSAGNESDPRFPGYAHLGQTERHQPADLSLAEQRAVRQDDLSRAHVFADGDDVFPHRDRAHNFDFTWATVKVAPTDLLGVLHHHHRVGTGRQHAARVDERALRRVESQRGGRAHGNLADEGQICGQGLARAEGVCGADGVPVHGGARELGERVRRGHVGGEDAAEGEERVQRRRVRQRRRPERSRRVREMREQEGAGFVGRK